MKKTVLYLLAFFSGIVLSAQSKRPTIMVIPSDNWCVTNGYVQEYNNQGKRTVSPDYKAALQNSSDLLLVISKINEMMSERGFPLKNLESCLKDLENQSAEDALLTSKGGGASVGETPIDKLKKVARADILIQLSYNVKPYGPKRTLTFNMQGLDAYTNKQIAGASGTSEPSYTPNTEILLEEAVLMHIDNFNNQLQAHFQDLLENGREIVVRIKTWEDFEDGLEREFEGEELGAIIEQWMSENTVNGVFNTTDATENMMLFEQVRIPMEKEINEKVVKIDARRWVGGLRKFLKEKYAIESKLMMQGLGQAQLVIGGK